MSIVNTTVSATTDGTYGMPNSIVGQIKTILLNDSKVSVISDNEPNNTAMRVLVYSVASQAHYCKIAATSGTAVSFSTLKLDGSTAITTAVSLTVTSGTAYSARLLYNSKAHAFAFNNFAIISTIYLDVGDSTNGWYVKVFGNTAATTNCYNNADTTYTLKYPSYGALDETGNFVGAPCRFVIGTTLSSYYYPYFYGTNTEILAANNSGFYTSGGYNFLVWGTYYILSDQVPS